MSHVTALSKRQASPLWYIDYFAGPWTSQAENLEDAPRLESAADVWREQGHRVETQVLFVRERTKAHKEFQDPTRLLPDGPPADLDEDAVMDPYRANQKERCRFSSSADVAIPHKTSERTWFHLVLGVNRPEGLDLIWRIEKTVKDEDRLVTGPADTQP